MSEIIELAGARAPKRASSEEADGLIELSAVGDTFVNALSRAKVHGAWTRLIFSGIEDVLTGEGKEPETMRVVNAKIVIPTSMLPALFQTLKRSLEANEIWQREG